MSDLAKDRERYAQRHWHWSKAKAKHILKNLLDDLEAMPGDGKLLAIPGVDKDGVDTLWFCTETEEGVYGPGYNNSTQCPPFGC